ncbi:hypothetical protein [Pseudovibrio exalbescens]|uniref:hypothetical protein n=1 Tax=Pseudovibrio exalbescens TaxID=197461 RepID=UPI002365730E|nr:hypothetical protein [Pseudovibrio exalbescens]
MGGVRSFLRSLSSKLRMGQSLHAPVKRIAKRLRPFMAEARNRYGSNPALFYRPFAIGFLGHVIDGMARVEGHTQDVDLVGVLQVKVWQEITGIDDPAIGDLMSQESVRQSEAFLKGWEMGARFCEVLADPEVFSLYFDVEQPEVENEESVLDSYEIFDVFSPSNEVELLNYDPRVIAAWRLSLDRGLS